MKGRRRVHSLHHKLQCIDCPNLPGGDFIVVHVSGHNAQFMAVQHGEEADIHNDIDNPGSGFLFFSIGSKHLPSCLARIENQSTGCSQINIGHRDERFKPMLRCLSLNERFASDETPAAAGFTLTFPP
jgi:hypothetical protein